MSRRKSSGEQTVTGFSMARPVKLFGIEIVPDGTNDVSYIIYDNSIASGKIVYQGATPGAAPRDGQTWEPPKHLTTGLFVAITSVGTFKYNIDYDWL